MIRDLVRSVMNFVNEFSLVVFTTPSVFNTNTTTHVGTDYMYVRSYVRCTFNFENKNHIGYQRRDDV